MFSEIRLMWKMFDAWWNPTAVYDVINRMHASSFDVQIREIFDVHGLSKSMVTVAKNALVYTKQKKWMFPKNKKFEHKLELHESATYNSFDEIQKSLSTADEKSQFMIMQQYINIVLWNEMMSPVICEKIDELISQKFDAGELTKNQISNIFKDIKLLQVTSFPHIVWIYEKIINCVQSPDELVQLVWEIPTFFRYDIKISISIYKKLKSFNGLSFLKPWCYTSDFYENIASYFSTDNNVMVIFELRKMFLKEIEPLIFSGGMPIMNIVAYAKNRSEILEKVFAWEEIIALLDKGNKLWVISVDDIEMSIWYIAKNEKERNMIRGSILSLRPKVDIVPEVIKEKQLRKIDSSEKEQFLYEACESIHLLPFVESKDKWFYSHKKNNNLIKLLSYYNQLLEINQNNIDFIINNLITYIENEHDPIFQKSTWEALIRLAYNHKHILSEQTLDTLFHTLWLYSIVLDYKFWYLTFHHYLFAWKFWEWFWEEESVNWMSYKDAKEAEVDAFFVQYKELFDSLVFTDTNTIGFKIKTIIDSTTYRQQINAKNLVTMIVESPYWRTPLNSEDVIWGKFSILFGLNRESYKKLLNKVFLNNLPEYQNLDSTINFYLFLLEHDVLSQNKESERFILQTIIKHLELSDAKEQYSYILKILQNHTIDISHIRIKIYEIFVNAVKQIIKNDRTLVSVFDDLSKCNLIDKYAIIETICSFFVTQESDSLYAKKSIYWWTINSDFINKLDSTILKEQQWVMVVSQVDKKTAVIDYLLSDWDQDVIDALTLELLSKDVLNLLAAFDDLWKTGTDILKNIGDKSDIHRKITELRDNGDIDWYRDLLKMHRELAIANETYTNIAILYHQNYWSSPFWIRALLLDHLVNHETDFNTYNEEIDSDEESFEQGRKNNIENQKEVEAYMYDKIINSILPQNSKYGKSCKKIFDVYYSVLQQYEKTLFLSAIIAWSEKSSTMNSDEQLGIILAHVLWSMWPAETKFWQALHSYPNTPKELSEWLYRLKSHAQVPPMWEIWEMLQNPAIIPNKISKHIVRVNNIYAGSIHITLICENKKWDEVVLTIQRENALWRINEGFNMITKVINKIGNDKQFTYLSHHANTILQEAKHITKNELNSEIMKEQYWIAHTMYNWTEVTYDGMKVNFEAPKLIAYGDWYKYISYLPWSHFNDIATSTIVTNDVKKSFAKIILFKELLSDYQWLCTDKDRHWDNIRVDFDKMTIGNFDFWGMTLTTPTDLQKKLLWQITAQVYKEYGTKGGEPLSVFLNMVDTFIVEYPNEVPFFATLQQRLLSLWDYFKILDKSDFQDIIVWVLSQNIDPIIKETIEQSVWLPLALLAGMSKFSISHTKQEDAQIPECINPSKVKKKYDPLHDFM